MGIIKLSDGREAAAGEIIVGFNENLSAVDERMILETAQKNGVLPGTVKKEFPHTSAVLIDVSQTDSIEQAIAAFEKINGVRYAEPNYTIKIPEN